MREGLWSGNKGSQCLGWVARQGGVSEGDRNPSGMIGMISMGRVDSAKDFRLRKQQASARSHVSLISPVVGVSPPHKGVHYTFQSTKGTSHTEICFPLFWSNRICSFFLTWILFKYLKIGIISLGDLFFPPPGWMLSVPSSIILVVWFINAFFELVFPWLWSVPSLQKKSQMF